MMRITINKAYFRSGEKTGVLRTSTSELLPRLPRDRDRLVVFTWPRIPGFRLKVIESVQGGQAGVRFTDNVVEYQAMLREIHPGIRAHDAVLRGELAVFAAVIPANSEDVIRLGATVDTNNSQFSTAQPVDLDGEPGVRLQLKVDGYVQGLLDIQDALDIPIDIRPACPLPRYTGYMAFDFGNTSCALVRLPKGQDGIEDLEVVPLELPPNQNSTNVASTLLVHDYDPPPDQERWRMAQAKITVGHQSGHGDLIIGAKRMLVDVDPSPYRMTLGSNTYLVRKQLPAELLISRIFARVGELSDDHPQAVGRLAITYPTTFSGWEVAKLHSTVYYAIRRALGVMEYFPHDAGLTPPSNEELRNVEREKKKRLKAAIPLLIDEASAASIFYLYKDFVKSPGSIRAMRYLYPNGLRILLYDCGGGTTDVALVKATGSIVPDEEGRARYRLRMDVLGRTGHRNFGGDKMTVAVFKLLKARIAERIFGLCDDVDHLNGIFPESLHVPDAPQLLPAHLEDTASLVNRVVPTRFNEQGDFDELLDLRQHAVRDIWDWAERIKRDLSTNQTVEHGLLAKGALVQLLNRVHGQFEWQDALEAPIAFKREEIDVLVSREIIESIDKVNYMIESKLTPGNEVDCVYVVGNASRYPLVCEELRKRLRVRFIDERLRFDGDPPDASAADGQSAAAAARNRVRVGDLKNAVAKGACIALMITRDFKNLHLEFDQEIVHRLPCDVLIPTLGENISPPAIFSEGEHCHHLDPHFAPAPAAPPGRERPAVMQLQRRWPGEQRAEPYLEFDFGHEIDGPVEVAYDEKREQFTMQDRRRDPRPILGKPMPVADYVSPVQSGDL